VGGRNSIAVQRRCNRRKRPSGSPLRHDPGNDLLAQVLGTATTRPGISKMLGKRRSRQADRTPRRATLARLDTDAAIDGVQTDPQQISSLAPRHKTTRLQQ
jgi:hypothetical protein